MSETTAIILIIVLVAYLAYKVVKDFHYDSLMIRRHQRRKLAEEKFTENILALDETADVKFMLEKYKTVEEIEKENVRLEKNRKRYDYSY